MQREDYGVKWENGMGSVKFDDFRTARVAIQSITRWLEVMEWLEEGLVDDDSKDTAPTTAPKAVKPARKGAARIRKARKRRVQSRRPRKG
jgi:hypothetical protein